MKEIVWGGRSPVKCDVKQEPISATFVDGRMARGGWANMCLDCHGLLGVGLGTGRGQRYDRQADGRWLRVA